MEPAEIAHHIRENGYCIVEDVIPSGEVGRIRERVVRAQAATDAAQPGQGKGDSSKGPPNRSPRRRRTQAGDQPRPVVRAVPGRPADRRGPRDLLRSLAADLLHRRRGEPPGERARLLARGLAVQPDERLQCRRPLPERDDARVVAVDADRFLRRQRRDAAVAGHAPEGPQPGDGRPPRLRQRGTPAGRDSTPRAGRDRCCSTTAGSGTRLPPTGAAAPGWP